MVNKIRAKILRIEQRPSRYGSHFYYVFLKDELGQSYRTCLYPHFRNYKNWIKALQAHEKREVWLNGLILKDNGLVDADSSFKMDNPDYLEADPEPLFHNEPKPPSPNYDRGHKILQDAMGRMG